MWKALTSLYEGKSVQRKMLLEAQMRSFMITKGEDIEHFLFRLQSIRDQQTATGATVDDAVIVRTPSMQSRMSGKPLSKVSWAERTSQIGTACGQSCGKKNYADSPRSSTALG